MRRALFILGGACLALFAAIVILATLFLGMYLLNPVGFLIAIAVAFVAGVGAMFGDDFFHNCGRKRQS